MQTTTNHSTHNLRWTQYPQFAGMVAGVDYTMGGLFNIDSWGWYYEVTFTKTGVTGLVRQQYGDIEAVKVPSKRGFKLHVCGTSHWVKYGRVRKGAGLMWADRMSWNTKGSIYSLADKCAGLPSWGERMTLAYSMTTVAA